MKIVLTLLLLLGFATSASAQEGVHPFAKGTKLIGFNTMGMSQTTSTDGRDGQMSGAIVSGQFGYSIIDGLVLGVDLNLILASSEEQNGFGGFTVDAKQSTIGLYGAYYYALSQRSAVYPELRIHKGTQDIAIDLSFFGKSEEKTDSRGVSIGLGYINRINQNIGLDFKIRTGSQTSQVDDSNGKTEFDLSKSELLVGFIIFF